MLNCFHWPSTCLISILDICHSDHTSWPLWKVSKKNYEPNHHHHHHHNRFMALFPRPPGWATEPVPEENFWTLWCKARLTEADTLTIRLGATPSGLTSAYLHHPPCFLQAGCPSWHPTNHQSTEGNKLWTKKLSKFILSNHIHIMSKMRHLVRHLDVVINLNTLLTKKQCWRSIYICQHMFTTLHMNIDEHMWSIVLTVSPLALCKSFTRMPVFTKQYKLVPVKGGDALKLVR